MRLHRKSSIEIKSPAEFALMREAGLVVAHVLSVVTEAVEPGISTAELDAIAEREVRAAGAMPSFKGYYGYPATICTSVNHQIVHAIPAAGASLAEGDVISLDAGAIVGGWHGDAAVTVPVGIVSRQLTELMAACELAMWHGLAAAIAGRRLGDVSHAVERSARASGPYGIVKEYTGHFIGSQMHMDPPVPNLGKGGRGPELETGMAMAIEPMLVLGRPRTRLLDDGWTVVTADGAAAAHFEHTVAVTADGPWVLTAQDGGASGFARLDARTADVCRTVAGRS